MTAVAIGNSRLVQNIHAALEGTVHIVSETVELKDPYTAGHQQRVTELACAIGKKLAFPDERLDGLRVAGLLHDIGKMAIPAEILSKPTRLSDSEFTLIQQHPQVAYNLLEHIQFPWPVAQIVLQHHERKDGSGYPSGLRRCCRRLCTTLRQRGVLISGTLIRPMNKAIRYGIPQDPIPLPSY